MSELSLEPCPFCGCDQVTVALNAERFHAGTCRACGARGPARAATQWQDTELVRAMAADDWNKSAPTFLPLHISEPEEIFPDTQANGTGKAAPSQPHEPVLCEKPVFSFRASTHPPAGEGGEGVSEPNDRGPAAASTHTEGQAYQDPGEDVGTESPGTLTPSEGASVEQFCNKAAGEPRENDRKPDNGGEAVTKPTRHPIADRIEAYLKKSGKSVWSGVFKGVTDQTVYNTLQGVSTPSSNTVNAIVAELNELEKVEVLPNKYPPVTGINRAPKPTAPPRCARTP